MASTSGLLPSATSTWPGAVRRKRTCVPISKSEPTLTTPGVSQITSTLPTLQPISASISISASRKASAARPTYHQAGASTPSSKASGAMPAVNRIARRPG